MAKWRYNGKEIKEIKEFDTTQLRYRVKLEPGDMVQHISGEIPLRFGGYNSTLVGDTNYRFSVISADYKKKRWGWDIKIQVIGIDPGYNLESVLAEFRYDAYMRGKVRIFPIDSVDKW